MASDDPWHPIEAELSQLVSGDEYQPLQPLLRRLQHMANAHYPEPRIVAGLLHIVKHMHEETGQGGNLRELVDRAASGLIQPEWDIEGDVHQAGRDLFQLTVVQVFSGARSELALDEPEPGISVPIVLLVMTAIDAQELISEEAFVGYPGELCREFQELHRVLEDEYGVADWLQRYRATPKAWQPFSGADGAESISQLVGELLSSIPRAKDDAPPFVPSFCDVRDLYNPNNYPSLWKLRREGCVVIMDTISMYHPKILRAFHWSVLDAYPATSVVTISPGHSVFEIMREMTAVIHLRVADMEFARRIDDIYDDVACEEIHKHNFQKWLVGRIKAMYPAELGIRGYMFDNLGPESL